MKTQNASKKDLDALRADVVDRFREVPWDLFNSPDLGASGETRFFVSRIQTDLLKIAERDRAGAGRIWDENVPAFVPRPAGLPPSEKETRIENTIAPGRPRKRSEPEAFLDGPARPVGPQEDKFKVKAPKTAPSPSRRPQPPLEPAPDPDDRRAQRTQLLLGGLQKQYLQADNRYHFRGQGAEVAFEAHEKRLVTHHETPFVVSSMIDLAEARGWSSLKLSGTKAFRREAWLQASVRGLEVQGYRPDKLDRLKLEEARADPSINRRNNAISHLDGISRTERSVQTNAGLKAGDREVPMTSRQEQYLDVMAAAMRQRGDSLHAIEKARQVASDRLRKDRVHVGTLIEVGSAPYQDKAGEPPSPYVSLKDDAGKTVKVWGVDLPRALEESGVKPGQRIALSYKGREPVDIPVNANNPSAGGKRTVNRNKWEIVLLDRSRGDARKAVMASARAQNEAPTLRVFDRNAPSSIRTPPSPTKQLQPRDRDRGR